MASAVVVYSAGTFVASSFGASFLPGDVFLRLGRSCDTYPYHTGPCPGSKVASGTQTWLPSGRGKTMRGIRVWSQYGYIDGPPSGERWYQEEMFEEARRAGARTLFFQGPPTDFVWLNGFAMQYFARKYGVTWVGSVDQADFAGFYVVPGHAPSPPSGFVPTRRLPLPDGGRLLLYRRGPALAPGAPVAVSADDLRRVAASGQPIYWAGPRPGATYELRLGADGSAAVRYLPPGMPAGDPRPALRVGTYPLADAFAATADAAALGDAVSVPIEGGVAFFSRRLPSHVFLAFQGVPVQIEVSSPEPGLARALVASGAIRPVEEAGR
ncbi:MAG: hypothetical protein C4305_08810 [Thermoleophilia bacterium]